MNLGFAKPMDIDALDRVSGVEAKRLLKQLVETATAPAFGILPQREYELQLFQIMRETGVIDRRASLYQLMTELRVSRAKARNLIFELEIRETVDQGVLDAKVRDALSNPKGFAEDGKYLALGIENPVVQAHLKDRVRQLGHLTDASFDSTLVKITPRALAALTEELMDDDDRTAFRDAMIDAGFSPDESLQGVIEAGLTHLTKRFAGEDMAEIAKHQIAGLAAMVTPRAQKTKARLKDLLRAAFDRRRRDTEPLRPNED